MLDYFLNICASVSKEFLVASYEVGSDSISLNVNSKKKNSCPKGLLTCCLPDAISKLGWLK